MSEPTANPDPDELPPALALMRMMSGYWVSQAIYVAAKLGIADRLKDGPKPAEELASLAGAHPRSLYRLLRALVGMGIFAETDGGRFDLTPLAACLQATAPDSMRSMAIMLGEEHYRAWGELLHSVRTGEPSWDYVYGSGIFDYFAEHPDSSKTFGDAMGDFSTQVAKAVTLAYDFSPLSTIVDVGGSHGVLLAAILRANPRLRGAVFDSSAVAESAKQYIERAGLSARCEIAAGDFFQAVPAGADAYLLKSVIHDWDDERAIAILQNCARAMAEKGRVLIIEMVIPPGNQPSFAKLLDVNMLVISGGQERTEAEYRTLLEAANLSLTRIVPTFLPVCILEGVKRDETSD